jgi:hypothetical protein
MSLSKSLAVGALTILLASCGAKKGSRNDLGSRGTLPDVTVPVNRKLAECSRIEASNIPLLGQLSTYYNPTTRTMVPDYVQMNIVSIPAGIKTGTKNYIQAYRWTDGPNGFQMNSIPVRMFFVNKITGSSVGSGISSPDYVDKISKTIIDGIISNRGLSAINITSSNFFEQHYVIMMGMEMQWKAVTFAFYDSDAGTNAISSGDALLPPFYADPNYYAQVNTQPTLYALHPNFVYRTSGASENEFKNLTDEICREFFSTIRIPASVGNDAPSLWSEISGFFMSIWSRISGWF